MSNNIKIKFLLLITALLLTACGTKSGNMQATQTLDPATKKMMAEPKLIQKDEHFEMKLNITKMKFKVGEPIVYSTSLTYIGNSKSILIWGGQTYILFNLTDGKKFEMNGTHTAELTSTKMIQGETHVYPFTKSGSYDLDDPNAAYWKKFYSEKDLLLPAGTYLISAKCDFSLTEKVIDSHYDREVHTTITVE